MRRLAGSFPFAALLLFTVGNSAIAKAQVYPSPNVNFPLTQVNQVSAPQTITLSDPGSPYNYVVQTASINGPNASDFQLNSNCSFPIYPGQSCWATIAFAPTTEGSRSLGITLNVVTPDGSESLSVPINISGTATERKCPPTTMVQFRPTFMNTPDVPVGGEDWLTATKVDQNGFPYDCAIVTLNLVSQGGAQVTSSPSTIQISDQVDYISLPDSADFVLTASTPSSRTGDLSFTASTTDNQGVITQLATPSFTFTAVDVQLSLQTSGSLDPQNNPTASGIPRQLQPYTSVSNKDGNYACVIPYQITGTVAPADYKGTVTLVRGDQLLLYQDPSNIPTKGSTNLMDDTSDPMVEVTTPSSTHTVFDYDAPAVSIPQTLPVGTTGRQRANFFEGAVLGSPPLPKTQTFNTPGIQLLGYLDGTHLLSFYSRISCQRTASGAVFDNTFAGDNTTALGMTMLSRTLQ